MNYKQAYTSLRGHGCPADEARRALNQAAAGTPSKTGELGGRRIAVTFNDDRGFSLTEFLLEQEA